MNAARPSALLAIAALSLCANPVFSAGPAATANPSHAARAANTANAVNGAMPFAPRYDDIMPVSQVKPGMVGYGLTVFRGTKIEKFGVTIVDVHKNAGGPGHDLILVRLSGGPITERKAFLIQGMSGSPVYVNGKIIGGFSQGEGMAKEPLGYVTPIEDMLEAWDPKLPDTPLAMLNDGKQRTIALRQPLNLDGRRITRVVANAPLSSPLKSTADTAVMHPCSTLLAFPRVSEAMRRKLQAALEPYNIQLAQDGPTANRKPDFKGAPIVPGAMFAMMLVTGDLSAGAGGTITYRRGDRVLGFGHPFMGIGPLATALTSAYVYDVYPLVNVSHKIWSPGPVVGSSAQDRNYSVSGVLHKMPKMIPVTVDVRDITTNRGRVYHVQVVPHPNLYSAMVSGTVGAAVADIRSIPGPAMARVTTTVEAEDVGKVTRANVVYDARGIDNAATADLDDLLGIFTSNPFYPVVIKSANVKVEIESGRKTAQVERIFLKEGKFSPGETVDLGVVIKPYKLPEVTKVVRIPIPANTPTGRYILQVKGGAIPGGISLGGIIIRPQSGGAAEQAPPVSIRQMVNRYDEREKNNDVVVRLLLPSTAVNVDGERLSNLPPSLDAVMRSAKSSGVRLERDEVKVVEPTDWVISGQQLLTINVQRKDTSESPSAAPPPVGGAAQGQTQLGSSDSNVDTDSGDQELSNPDDSAVELASRTGVDGKTAARAKADKTDDKGGKKDEKEGKPAQPTAAPAETKEPDPPAPATPAPAEANEKPVGRQPLTWRQTTRADFAKGDSTGLSVTTGGDLTLTRTLTKFQTSPESFAWSLIPDGKGGLYAGTGTAAKVLHVDSSGALKELAKLPEISVHALALGADGTLWAATGPNGHVYRIAPDGKFTLALTADEKYALAIVADSKGDVYVGTGGGHGNIYRIGRDGKAGLFYRTPEEHVLCLAIDRADNLYAGTSSNGIVYRITPEGRGSVLYDAAEASISAIGVNSRGDVYAATAPRGVIYRIAPDGMPKTVLDRSAAAFTALRVAADDTIYAAGGSAVYFLRPDDTATPFGNRSDIDILSLAVAKNGALYAGTGNVAEIYTASPATPRQTGTYESVVHDAKQTARWGSVRWTANIPAGTRVKVQTRTGNVAEPDATWSDWTEPRPQGDGGRIASPPARFIQYRVTIESDSASVSPALREISINYLPKNQPPKITFSSPAGGERWARNQTVKWDASDPDKDTLTYQLYYSTDNGATWLPLPEGVAAKPVTETKTAAPAVPSPVSKATGTGPASVPLGSGPPSVAAVQAELDKHPDLPASLREAILERARKVNADYQAPGQSGPRAAASAPQTPIKQTSRAVDTRLLPDGKYMLKVVTTDRPSNPVEPRTAESVSEPFIVCNTPPTLVLLHASIQLRPDRTVTLEGTALQTMIQVIAVQFRVDGGEWMAAVPQDGIFDGASESFTLATLALTPGKHVIEVKAFNAANNTTAEKVEVEVK